jgi:4-hydroxyphenylacetate 3-monooxygenase
MGETTKVSGAENVTVTHNNLFTGEDFLESLRDDRGVYIYGEKVEDVTEHPAFYNSARSIARLYDALHDPETRDTLTDVDKFGNRTHKFFKPSYSAQELLEAREAIVEWSKMSYGFMGRTPDYKASFMATLLANSDFYEPFQENAINWYKKYASQGLFLNHTLINPPVDRDRPVHEVRDVFVHVEEERDDGIVVSGAKMLATGSALTHATFVAQNSAVHLEEDKAEDFALVFIAPMDTPGTKLLSRGSYEDKAYSPFDHPLSSRFDENDAVLIFDDAFIPWENVLVYRDVERATSFYPASGFMNRYTLQSGTRLAVKLDFMCGLFAKGTAANGTDQFRSLQVAMGELIGWRTMMWALTTAMALNPEEGPGGTVQPTLEDGTTVRMLGPLVWPKFKNMLEEYLGGSPLVTPSSYKDMKDPDLRPLIEKYYRGSESSAEERIKLFKLIWDAIGTEFGGRHELYERHYGGNPEQVRLDLLKFADVKGFKDQFTDFVDQCMSDYDLDGWKSPIWSPSKDGDE